MWISNITIYCCLVSSLRATALIEIKDNFYHKHFRMLNVGMETIVSQNMLVLRLNMRQPIFFKYSQPIAWASYQIRKIAGCTCAENAGNVFPHRRFRRKPLVSDPGMHHSTCVRHVPWCMSGSLNCGDGENVPGIPGACAPAILRIWQEAHVAHPLWWDMGYLSKLKFFYEFEIVSILFTCECSTVWTSFYIKLCSDQYKYTTLTKENYFHHGSWNGLKDGLWNNFLHQDVANHNFQIFYFTMAPHNKIMFNSLSMWVTCLVGEWMSWNSNMDLPISGEYLTQEQMLFLICDKISGYLVLLPL